MTNYKQLCAELQALLTAIEDDVIDTNDGPRFQEAVDRARAALAEPEPAALPDDYIDPEHSGADRELLETFYTACRGEGGTADEIHLRGLHVVLARWGRPAPEPEPVPVPVAWCRTDEFSNAMQRGGSFKGWKDPGAGAYKCDMRLYAFPPQPH